MVCENAQFASTSGFDRITNNAQDHGLSPHDVVLYFQGLGLRVSHFDWTPMRYTSVAEYSEGDLQDGYVVLPYDAPAKCWDGPPIPRVPDERRDVHQREGRHLGPRIVRLSPRHLSSSISRFSSPIMRSTARQSA
ncbi:MAG: hypothetical protein R3E12_06675 [Candidatus Eisenbacteria bacterium]